MSDSVNDEGSQRRTSIPVVVETVGETITQWIKKNGEICQLTL